jgi:hypothetical protein
MQGDDRGAGVTKAACLRHMQASKWTRTEIECVQEHVVAYISSLRNDQGRATTHRTSLDSTRRHPCWAAIAVIVRQE